MIVYWTACLASMLAAGACLQASYLQKHRWITVMLSALPMILVAALRYDVGEDYLRTYVAYFENVQQQASSGYSKMEPLYHLLNVVVAALHGDSFWVFAVCAVLFYALVYGQIMEDSAHPLLSIFLLTGMCYCFVFFNAMRQLVGCAILLYSLRFIQRRQLWPFLVCVLLAAMFHKSCALFVIMYWAGRIRIRPAASLTVLAVVALGGQALALLMRWIISRTQYAIYLLSVFDTGETAMVMLAINLVLMVFMSICYREDEQYQLYYNLQLLACVMVMLSGKVVLILRLLWMFGLPSVIALPGAMDNLPMNDRNRKLIMAIVMLFYFAYATYTVGVQNSNNVLPYQTIFSRWY
ncbi:MAG: EpsG family protein [Aristaeellaceae bacterium]